MGLTGVRHELEYIVVQDMAQLGHPITWVCQALSISRSAYYHWLHRTPSARERENRHILDEMRHLYQAYRGIYGYRRLADEYNAIHHTNYNEKRFHRLAKIGNLRAIIRTKQPAPHAAPLMQLPANILARDFVAQAICDYIHFYNTRRRQRRLDKLPPLAYRAQQALLSESGES